MTKTKKSESKQSFESSLEKLETIVDSFEDGNLGLDDSLKAFEEGMKLAKLCEEKLDEAQGRVEKIMIDVGGDASVSAFEEGNWNEEDV